MRCGSQDPRSRRLVWVLGGNGGENEWIGDLEAKETSARGERKTTAQPLQQGRRQNCWFLWEYYNAGGTMTSNWMRSDGTGCSSSVTWLLRGLPNFEWRSNWSSPVGFEFHVYIHLSYFFMTLTYSKGLMSPYP